MDVMELMQEEINTSPEKRLERLLEFLGTPVAQLSAEERDAWAHRLALMSPGIPGVAWQRQHQPLSGPRLAAMHRVLREGVQELLKGKGWRFEVAGTVELLRMRAGRAGAGGEALVESHFQWRATGATQTLLLLSVADLIYRHGQRLRECERERCGNPFLAVKRQKFCSPQCAQLARDERKKED